MAETSSEISAPQSYAVSVASGSYEWYRRAAMKARRYYRLSETAQLVISAGVPVAAVLAPGNTKVPAVLGGIVVVIAGLRSIFHWHDDYLRFNRAREAVEGERRRYMTGAVPYDDPDTRDEVLATTITRIEQQEMDSWFQIATRRSDKESG